MFRNSGFTAGGSLALGIVRLTPFARLTAGEDAGEPFAEGICVANIGPEQRRQRLRFGAQAFAVGAGLAALLIFIHANPLFRLGLFVPFVMGAEGFFQAREKTWVGLASRGARDMDSGEEQIEDSAVLRQVRRQALKVNIESFLAAVLLTALCLLIPA